MAELNDLRAQLLALGEEIVSLGDRKPKDDAEDEAITSRMEDLEKQYQATDGQVKRATRVQEIKASLAKPLTIEAREGQFMTGGPVVRKTKGGSAVATSNYYETNGPGHFQAQRQPFEEVGIGFARYVKIWALAGGHIGTAQEMARHLYPDDGRLDFQAALVQNVGTSGGFLVPEEQSRELVSLLRNIAKVRPNARVIPIHGTMTMPVVTAGSAASYLGESTDDLAQDLQFGQRRLTAHKLRALVPISNDLVRNSSPEADMVVRDDLAGALAEAEDLAFIRGTGLGDNPKGMRYWAPTAAVNNGTGTTAAAIEADLINMVARLVAAKKSQLGSPRWFMTSRTYYKLFQLRYAIGTDPMQLVFPEVRSGQPMLLGYPVSISDQIPITLSPGTVTEIYLADMADAIIGEEMGITIAVSDVASYKDSGGTLQSAFSLDQIVLRAISKHDFIMRRDASVQVLTGSNTTY
jgi:HK97 family phage major capsid protein